MSNYYSCSLPRNHPASSWSVLDIERDVDGVMRLGEAYFAAGDVEKPVIAERILRCYHGYLMKYLSMIRTGTVPSFEGRVNRDCFMFLRYLVDRSKGKANRANLAAAAHKLHFSFKGEDDGEIYDILSTLLMKAVNRFDPYYSDKMKQVVRAIGRGRRKATGEGPEFTREEVSERAGLDACKFLRVLARRGYLKSTTTRDGRVSGYRKLSWPPSEELYCNKVGFAYVVQIWFRYHLREYIKGRMNTPEARADVMQLEQIYHNNFGTFQDSEAGDVLIAIDGELESHHRTATGHLNRYRVDRSLQRAEMDLTSLDLEWVNKTRDPLFRGLDRVERYVLYFRHREDMTFKEIGERLGIGLKKATDIYNQTIAKCRQLAGVAEEN